ncbi:MAG: ABC transporter ATP-binding protein [Rikenellaceae bacterium]
MSKFKLIAIEALEGCAEYIHKNLEIGKKYYFYKGYTIKDENSYEIDNKIVLPNNFFDQDGKISIHALVGRNGSGKSNLIDLLLRIINSYSCNGVIDHRENMQINPGLVAKLYYAIKDQLYALECNCAEDGKSSTCKMTKLATEAKESAELILIKDERLQNCTDSEFETHQLDCFFHSIIVNYSLYAYNEHEYKNETPLHIETTDGYDNGIYWLRGLFHKNDGYKAPIVINPFRHKGCIDVNNEKYLTYNRFISLMVNEDKNKRITKVNETKEVEEISLRSISDFDDTSAKVAKFILDTINEHLNGFKQIIEDPSRVCKQLIDVILNKRDLYIVENNIVRSYLENIEIFGNTILRTWHEQLGITPSYNQEFKINGIPENYHDWYIITKTIKTSEKYRDILGTWRLSWAKILSGDGYDPDSETNGDIESVIKDAIGKLMRDKSHITLKLRQALVYKYLSNESYLHDMNMSVEKLNTNVLELETKTKELFTNKTALEFMNSDILNFLPPPIFNVDITLKESKKNSNNSSFQFSKLSSGEKQYIFSNATILYHLRNLDSAHYSEEGKNRVKYKFANIILDEIELCYHPEMQRKQVSDLIKYIGMLGLKNIEGINICLLTHSPMILSDIPHCNILQLKDKKDNEEKEEKEEPLPNTFGANIHTLYKDSFFMDLPMGEFAKKKIVGLFDKLNCDKELSITELKEIKKEIDLVGEPILQKQLLNIYDNKLNSHHEKSSIREQIDFHQEEINRLEKELKND